MARPGGKNVNFGTKEAKVLILMLGRSIQFPHLEPERSVVRLGTVVIKMRR